MFQLLAPISPTMNFKKRCEKPLTCIPRRLNPIVTNRIQTCLRRLEFSETSEKMSETSEIYEASEIAALSTSRRSFKMRELFLGRRQNAKPTRQRRAIQS